MRKKKWKLFLGVIVALFCVGLCLRYMGVFTEDNLLRNFRNLIEENYILAVGCYLICTILGSVFLAIPGVIYAVVAGAVFGPIEGTALCVAGASIGASFAFLMGRYFLNEQIRPLVEKNYHLKRWLLDNSGFNQWILLVITRLVPVFPFNLQNFAYGITNIGFWKYSIGTFFLIIPGTAMYTFISAGVLSEGFKIATWIVSLVLCITLIALSYFLKKRFNISE